MLAPSEPKGAVVKKGTWHKIEKRARSWYNRKLYREKLRGVDMFLPVGVGVVSGMFFGMLLAIVTLPYWSWWQSLSVGVIALLCCIRMPYWGYALWVRCEAVPLPAYQTIASFLKEELLSLEEETTGTSSPLWRLSSRIVTQIRCAEEVVCGLTTESATNNPIVPLSEISDALQVAKQAVAKLEEQRCRLQAEIDRYNQLFGAMRRELSVLTDSNSALNLVLRAHQLSATAEAMPQKVQETIEDTVGLFCHRLVVLRGLSISMADSPHLLRFVGEQVTSSRLEVDLEHIHRLVDGCVERSDRLRQQLRLD